MLASGFTAAPVSKCLFFSIVITSILVSVMDIKYLFHIQLVPHIWRFKQFWRLLIWQSCYNNSTELLAGIMTMYHLRVIERLWGSRKFAVRIFSPTQRYPVTRRAGLLIRVISLSSSLPSLSAFYCHPVSLLSFARSRFLLSTPYRLVLHPSYLHC